MGKRIEKSWLPGALAALVLAVASQAGAVTCTTGTVNTPSGPYCGIVSQASGGSVSANAFLGIRYARQPGRWQVAQAATPSTSTYSAVQYGNICPQPAPPSPVPGCTKAPSPPQSEDCLFLNLWVPEGTAPDARLPVKVFIHGGAFILGSGTSPLYDGTGLAGTDKVIVVDFNYRLGSLGFLALDGITNSTNNNFGFRDQILALQWVQTNIASFGGDPGNVTLWGESAGAMSVGLHALSSTQSAGLFQAGVMESNPLGIPYKTIDQAKKVGQRFAHQLGCRNTKRRADCLRGKSPSELIAAEQGAHLTSWLFGPQWLLVWTPALDQTSWPHPLFRGEPIDGSPTVPLLFGTNQDEGTLFVQGILQAVKTIPSWKYDVILADVFGSNAFKIKSPRYKCASEKDCTQALANVLTDYDFSCANRYLGVKTSQTASTPAVYAYFFSQVSSFNFWPGVPACKGKVCHGDELPYVFNTPSAVCQEDSFNDSELGLAKDMGGYWTSFDKDHPPVSSSGPWSVFGSTQSYMSLKVSPENVTDPLRTVANCDLWDKIGYEPSKAWSRALARAVK